MQCNRDCLQEFVYDCRLQRVRVSMWLAWGYFTEVHQTVSVPCWEAGPETHTPASFNLRVNTMEK